MANYITGNEFYACCDEAVANSGQLCGTSNMVFSKWKVTAHFRLRNGLPEVSFKVGNGWFSSNPPLYETDNYADLQKWIEAHKEEINKQVETATQEWMERYKNYI